jgi:hypothetical protein
MGVSTGESSSCPFCLSSIQVEGANWQCPCCGTLNSNWDTARCCQNCRFTPFYLKCPICQQELEIVSLTDTSGEGEERQVPTKPNLWEGQETCLRNLLPSTAYAIEQNEDVYHFVAQLLSMSKDFPFRFVGPVKSFRIETVWVGGDQRFWIHGSLYASQTPDPDARVGHLGISAEMDEAGQLSAPNIALVEALSTTPGS